MRQAQQVYCKGVNPRLSVPSFLRNGKPVDGASVIQPNHLRKVDIPAKSNEFAVGILESENW